MARSFLQRMYDGYALGYRPGQPSWLHRLHRKIVRSPRLARWLFGIRVIESEKPDSYFHVTTIVMRKLLRQRLKRNPDLRLLEIGAGKFAILSGYLSRFANHTIEAAEVNPKRAELAKSHVALNQFDVHVALSDLFSNVPAGPYDVIFWNLPYYDDPAYLDRLFAAAPSHLSRDGELILGYNSKPLPRQTVLDILVKHQSLRLAEVVTWWWNLHDVLIIKPV